MILNRSSLNKVCWSVLKPLTVIISIFFISSCTTLPLGDYLSYKNKISQIDLSKSVAQVNMIDNSGQGMDPDGSLKAEENIYQAVKEVLGTKYTISSKELETPPLNFELAIRSLFGSLNLNKDVNAVIKLPVVVRYLNRYPERYFIFTYETGFARTGANVASSVFGGILIGILTLGLIVPVPITATSDLYLCVIDKENMKVIYYKSNHTQEDPKNYETILNQMKGILKDLILL